MLVTSQSCCWDSKLVPDLSFSSGKWIKPLHPLDSVSLCYLWVWHCTFAGNCRKWAHHGPSTTGASTAESSTCVARLCAKKFHCGIQPFGQAAETAKDCKGSTHLLEHGAAKKLQRYIANHTPKDGKSTFAPKILDMAWFDKGAFLHLYIICLWALLNYNGIPYISSQTIKITCTGKCSKNKLSIKCK